MVAVTKVCSFGKHPPYPCACGGYRDRQCCDVRAFGIREGDADYYGPCPVHKCGVRKGCKCPTGTGSAR